MSIAVVVLAAGKGTRMKSALPKVLHPLAKKPMVCHVLDTAATLTPDVNIVVYGHKGELVKKTLADQQISWAEQKEQKGTGHAVQQAVPFLGQSDKVLILYGDVPLTQPETLAKLVNNASDFSLLTIKLDNPSGYGRIVRNQAGEVQAIVEQKDATDEQLLIDEINTGIMAVKREYLEKWLNQLSNNNAQGEYYLTDIVSMAVKDGLTINTENPTHAWEVEGVNSRLQLATLERTWQIREAARLLEDGVMIIDPQRFDLRGTLTYGQDVSIDVNVIIEGDVTLGNRVHIGANTVIKDCQIGDDVAIYENCVLEQAHIGNNSQVGPFSRLRPGADLVADNKVGNFVEIKKSTIGKGSKVSHLSYIGDTQMGETVNIGAGTITCNYDGINKHQTTIGDKVFVGSNSALVAPVKLGEGATIGAGSVISGEAPKGKLTLERSNQRTIDHWVRPTKK